MGACAMAGVIGRRPGRRGGKPGEGAQDAGGGAGAAEQRHPGRGGRRLRGRVGVADGHERDHRGRHAGVQGDLAGGGDRARREGALVRPCPCLLVDGEDEQVGPAAGRGGESCREHLARFPGPP